MVLLTIMPCCTADTRRSMLDKTRKLTRHDGPLRNSKKRGDGNFLSQHNSETIHRIVLNMELDLCTVILNIILKFENN